VSNSASSNRTLTRFGAGLAGVLVGVGLSLGTDAALHKTGIFPALGQRMSNELFALATAYWRTPFLAATSRHGWSPTAPCK
jgi:hypothetical protein